MGNVTVADREGSRTPVLRPRASVDDLATLHPVERALYRLFEYMASIRLAIVLMIWLMIECAVGTRIESTINASAAKYFVYGNTRFHILLAIMALNVLFAALIRYPWKRYQTGFLVTHIGLLLILGGSMVTSIAHIDALLSVGQNEINDAMIHPDEDVFRVSVEDPSTGKTKEELLKVRFGPLTWGAKILGTIPWGRGHEEVIPLVGIEPGAKLRVKRFIAHSDWRETYVPDKIGVPAVKMVLTAPSVGGFEQSAWIAARATEIGFMTDTQVDVGGIPVRTRLWRAGSQAEIDHFVKAAPKGAIQGAFGEVGLTFGGESFRVSVDELRRAPFVQEGIKLKVELVEAMPHAQLDREKQVWVNVGEDPNYPAVKLRVTKGDQPPIETMAFANNPEFDRLLASRSGLAEGEFVTLFRSDQPTEIQLLVSAGGQVAYRCFSNQQCVASVVCQEGESYPSFGMFKFAAGTVLASARPDLEIIPKPVPPGEETFPAVEVEYVSGKGEATTLHLVRRLPETTRFVDGKIVRLRYDIHSESLPFAIRLDDFNEPKQPGTSMAARYESFVTVFEKKDLPLEKYQANNPLHQKQGDKAIELVESRKAEIKMNHPLFFAGEDGREYTLYQSGIARPEGRAVSTYTVAYDPGLLLKYLGAVVLCLGIFLMFYMGGYFRSRPNRPVKAEAEVLDEVGEHRA